MAVIEHLMKSKSKTEKFRLKRRLIDRAAVELTNYEKTEARRRRRKRKRYGKKKPNQEAIVKNGADALVTNDSGKVIQAAGKSKNTSTSLIQASEVNSDPVMTDKHLPKETVNIRVTDSNREDDQKNKKETEESNYENSVAVPCMKRKCGLTLSELENMDVGLRQLKVRRKELPKFSKVRKDKASEMSKKKLADGMQRQSSSNFTSESSTQGSRMSVGGDWKVSDVAGTELKVSHYRVL